MFVSDAERGLPSDWYMQCDVKSLRSVVGYYLTGR
jgi:hypothetical protein